jgi:hypothetical protein
MDISRNNAYDARLREILSQQHQQAGDYQQTPEIFVGGTRPTRYTSPGNTAYDNEANFATVGAGKFRSEDLVHAVDVAMTHPMARRLTGRVPKGLGSVSNFVQREKMATRKVGGRRKLANEGPVGGVNRLKKANRWLGFVTKGIGSVVRPITEPIANAIGQTGAKIVEAQGARYGAGKFEDFLGKLKRGYDRVPQPLKQLAEASAARGVGQLVKKISGGRKPSARGEIVKKVMKEHGLSLPQASKYVKDHGLYKK